MKYIKQFYESHKVGYKEEFISRGIKSQIFFGLTDVEGNEFNFIVMTWLRGHRTPYIECDFKIDKYSLNDTMELIELMIHLKAMINSSIAYDDVFRYLIRHNFEDITQGISDFTEDMEFFSEEYGDEFDNLSLDEKEEFLRSKNYDFESRDTLDENIFRVISEDENEYRLSNLDDIFKWIDTDE